MLTVRVLVVNAGSSSLKLRLPGARDAVEHSADLPAGPGGFDASSLAGILQGWGEPDAVGHRIVHGGTMFTGPVLIDGAVREQLRALTDLAPLHQPKSLAALNAVTALLPGVPAVACFDTAFHTTIPRPPRPTRCPANGGNATRSAVTASTGCRTPTARRGPRSCSDGRRRACGSSPATSARAPRWRPCSMTAASTPPWVSPRWKGWSWRPRSGTVDPGLVLWLEEHEHLPPHEVATALEQRSGLLALARTGDMRQVQAAADRGDPDARLAIDVCIHRLAGGVAAMSAATGGIDVLAFTGGVGEGSAMVRRRAARWLAYLGVAVDLHRNDHARDDRDITAAAATVRTLVINAREDLQIAGEARRLLSTP